MNERPTYSPDMERLKKELGRAPEPPVVESKPEDFAPKQQRTAARENRAPYIAQALKTVMRGAPKWLHLSVGEQESLDRMATAISFILTDGDESGGHNWKDIEELAKGALE